MCTITWRAAPGLREIYFNRDELKTRAAALPPSIRHSTEGNEYIAPHDPDGGGTWLAVNDYGLIVAMLNLYPKNALAVWSPRRSRGLLVQDLMNCRNPIEVSTWLHEENLEYYRPFTLLAFHLDFPDPLWAEWKNPHFDLRRDASANMPITGSSYATSEVIASRKQRFKEMLENQGDGDEAEMLRSFHHDTQALDPAHAVFMERSDARTVSYTEVHLDRHRATLRYWECDPKTRLLADKTELSIALRHGFH